MQRTPATPMGTQSADLAGRTVAPPTAQAEMGRVTATEVIIADPAPLGLAAFGVTTLILSVINAGWLAAGATVAVLSMALAYGGISQFVAGLWAFRRGNTFAATAFCSYGAFWISYFLLVNTFAAQIKPASAVPGFLGLYLLAWGIFTAYMTIASLAASKAVTVVFILLTATFFLLCAGQWSGSAAIGNLGGYVGILTAIAALYTSFADVTNAAMRRVVLPTGSPFAA